MLLQNCLPLIQTLRAVCILPKEAASAWVSRGGRPDLAGKVILRRVHAPTLLLVGGNDEEVLNLNVNALKDIKAEKKTLTIIPGATHRQA